MENSYHAVVIGASAGGTEALCTILPGLPGNFYPPIVLVEHVGNNDISPFITCLQAYTPIKIKEAEPREAISPNTIFVAPSGYHLLIEEDRCFSLSVDPEVSYARPSIDVLFESAAETFQHRVVGVILSGANGDGTNGMQSIKQQGGHTIAQAPESATIATMPQSAIDAGVVDRVLPLDKIASYLTNLCYSDNIE